jgi:hypothetical protein
MMKRLITITLVTSVLSACGSPDSVSTDKAITRDFEGEQGMEPGRGYGGVFEDSRGLCVEYDAVNAAGQGQETVFQLQMIENHSDLAAKLNISSASQVKAAVPDSPATVSAKTKFALNSSLTINKYSVYAMVSTVVKNETSHLKNVRLKADARALLEGENSSIDRFRVQCGDEFIGSYTTGGEFFGIVEVKTMSREEQIEVSRELAANVGVEGIGEAGSESSMQAALTRVTKNHDFRIWTFQRGGSGETANPVSTVNDMIARAKNLPKIVQEPAQARILTGTFHDYLTLPVNLPASYQPALLTARRTIHQLGKIQANMMDVRANIDYITMHPEQFNGVNGAFLADLTKLRDELDKRMERVYNIAQGCYTDFTRCGIPADIKAPEFSEPSRIRPRTEPEAFKFQIQPTYVNKSKVSDYWSKGECYLTLTVNGEGGKQATIVRTQIYDNCDIPKLELSVDLDRVVSAFDSIGIKPSDGWFSVALYEADSYYDDFLGNTAFWYSNISESKTMRTQFSNEYAIMVINVTRR